MAVYAVKHRCGHTQHHKRWGRYSKTEQWNMSCSLGQMKCIECYRPKTWRRDVAAAIEWAEKLGLPPLRGSKKQLIWAQQLRGKFGPRIVEIRSRYEATDFKEDPAAGDLITVVDYVLARDSADWWIEYGAPVPGLHGLLIRGFISLQQKLGKWVFDNSVDLNEFHERERQFERFKMLLEYDEQEFPEAYPETTLAMTPALAPPKQP